MRLSATPYLVASVRFCELQYTKSLSHLSLDIPSNRLSLAKGDWDSYCPQRGVDPDKKAMSLLARSRYNPLPHFDTTQYIIIFTASATKCILLEVPETYNNNNNNNPQNATHYSSLNIARALIL